jgi:hypothetical protein
MTRARARVLVAKLPEEEQPVPTMTIETEAAVASYRSCLCLISGFAISRAQSMNSRAKGLRVRPITRTST